MLIRIKDTTFGLVVNGIVKPKTPKDPPFPVEDDVARRLIGLGFAEAVDGEIPNEESEEDVLSGKPEYSDANTKSELQAIAKEFGVEISDKASKAEIIAELDEYFSDIPDLSAEV